MNPVEVILSAKRQRYSTASQKKTIIEETELPVMSISAAARKYETHPSQILRWRRLVQKGALSAPGADESVVPSLKRRKNWSAARHEDNGKVYGLGIRL